MMLLRLPTASAREVGDPSHPLVRLSAHDTWSEDDLDKVIGHLRSGDCVHVTLMLRRGGRSRIGVGPAVTTREDAVQGRLTALASVVGPDARRVMVRVEREPSVPARWWGRWAWRRGVGGARRPPGRAFPLDELLTPTEPAPDEVGPCTGRPHVLAVAASPLSWDVIDELHRCVSAGLEAHLVLSVPRSPASRDPALHVLWERRMRLDVADREREAAQLWPDASLVRIEVVRTHVAAERGRRARRLDRWTP